MVHLSVNLPHMNNLGRLLKTCKDTQILLSKNVKIYVNRIVKLLSSFILEYKWDETKMAVTKDINFYQRTPKTEIIAR